MTSPVTVDRETIETLLALLNPLHRSLDRQTYDQKIGADFDAPRDAEYNVDITTQMERDLTQAVCILESRLRDPLIHAQTQQEPIAWRCKDYADGWIYIDDKVSAELYRRDTDCLMQPLYLRAQCAPTEQIPVGYIVRNKETGAIASQHIALNRPDAEAWANTFKPEWELQPVYLAANGYTLTSTSSCTPLSAPGDAQ